MKTNVFDMTADERAIALEMCRERDCRDAVRFFRNCVATGPRTHRGMKVQPSTSLGQVWVVGVYSGKGMAVYLGDKTDWKPTATVLGSSNDWPALLQAFADIHCRCKHIISEEPKCLKCGAVLDETGECPDCEG